MDSRRSIDIGMAHQISTDAAARAPEENPHGLHVVAPDLAYQRLAIVNVVYVGEANAGPGGWVLIDAGVPMTATTIRNAAKFRFGIGAAPSAIMLTHGHFDHIGVVHQLATEWDVPVYAHEHEAPYLNGTRAYDKPDPTVGGLMARLSPLFPRGPVDLGSRLHILPPDGSIPVLPEWRWISTPGHTPGHISLWRQRDRALIVGDAFITTEQESAYAVAVQKEEIHGPPQYFTPDWPSSAASVRRLAALEPELVITGHGRAMKGPRMREALHALARDFERVALPGSEKPGA